MKKLYRILAAIAMATAVLALSGCGDKTPNDDGPKGVIDPDASIVGRWKITRTERIFMPKVGETTTDITDFTESGMDMFVYYFEFNADGTAIKEYSSMNYNYTWSLTGTKLTLTGGDELEPNNTLITLTEEELVYLNHEVSIEANYEAKETYYYVRVASED